MGPQLYRCGDIGITMTATGIMALQWGRNFIVAETLKWPIIEAWTHGLQWGRNFIVAETPYGIGRLAC